jgi:hypothetical protein
MVNYRTSRILPIVLVIVIILIAVAAIVSLARVVFFSGSSTPDVIDESRTALLDTTAGRSVSMTVRGPIVADEDFHSYQIDISPTGRSIKTYAGYLESITASNNLTNNVASYEQFVYALDKADLADGSELPGDRNDVRGVCATGRVYEFAILNNGEAVKKLWTSTCKGSKGSLDASATQLTNLFVSQIPDADTLIKKVDL